MKESFIKEINKIQNESLKLASMEMVENAPEYFWTAAASVSGRFHPKCSAGIGGLVRHSILAERIGLDLLNAEIFVKDTPIARDLVIVSMLFHDVIKLGHDENGVKTATEHPILSSNFVNQYLTKHNVDEYIRETICSSISTHMGKWTYCNNSNYSLTKPYTDFEKLIHTADLMASKKYMKGLDEWTTTQKIVE